MKLSVVVIAHNEENSIERCIESVLNQTISADEIIVVVHNSTDQTLNKVLPFEKDPRVVIRNYSGPEGIVFARIDGISQAVGDYIFCIDGDAYAQRNWISALLECLRKPNVVLAGSTVHFFGNLFWTLGSLLNRVFATFSPDKTGWIWGPSFAFAKKDTSSVIVFLKESLEVSQKLHLDRNPDDYWLALRMKELGNTVYTNKTRVFAQTKQVSSKESWVRHRSDVSNGKKLLKYYKENILRSM